MSNYLTCDNIEMKLDKITLTIDGLKLPKGYIYTIIGNNGAGKSTFLRIASGMISKRKWQIKGFDHVSYVPSDFTVLDAFSYKQTLKLFNSNKHFDESLFRDHMFSFGLGGIDKIKDLSKGDKKCLLLCLALANQPKVLLLDELSNGLDSVRHEKVSDILQSYMEDPTNTIIYASNQISSTVDISDYFLIMKDGFIEGPLDSISLREKYLVVPKMQSAYGEIYNGLGNLIERTNTDPYSDLESILMCLGGTQDVQ